MRYIIGLLCLLASTVAAEVQGDLLRMQGVWMIERATRDGKDLVDRQGARFIFSGAQLSVVPKKGKGSSAPVHLAEVEMPRRLVIDGVGPSENCKPLNCAYEWTPAGLIICMADPDKLPKEMSDHGQTLYVLRRQKEEPIHAPQPRTGLEPGRG